MRPPLLRPTATVLPPSAAVEAHLRLSILLHMLVVQTPFQTHHISGETAPRPAVLPRSDHDMLPELWGTTRV